MSGSTGRRSVTSRSCAEDDAALRAELRAFSRKRPRWGYRQAHQHLLDEGWAINRKRVQRLWREEGLRVPQQAPQAPAARGIDGAGDRLRAERPDHVWAFDFQFDVTDDGRAVKLLYVVDEFTREALAMEAERRIDADKVVDVLDRIVAERGTPPGVRPLRQRAGDDLQRAAGLVPVQPDRRARSSSPAARGRTRSSRASTAASATSCWPSRCSPAWPRRRCMVEDFRQDYNRYRPHRAHGMMTPAAFSRGWEDRPRGRARQRRTTPAYAPSPFDAGGSPYPAGTNQPPALTAGGPMNGVRPAGQHLDDRSLHHAVAQSWRLGLGGMAAALRSVQAERSYARQAPFADLTKGWKAVLPSAFPDGRWALIEP